MKRLICLFIVMMSILSFIGCSKQDDQLLSGKEKPDKIISTLNKNISGDENQLKLMTSESRTPVYRAKSGFEVKISSSVSGGEALYLLYSTSKFSDDDAESILKGVLSSLNKGDAESIAHKIVSSAGDTEESMGEFVVQKIDVSQLKVRDDEKDVYEIPVVAIRVFIKTKDNANFNNQINSMQDFKEEIRHDDSLNNAYDYYKEFFSPNAKPEGLENIELM